MPGPYVCVGCEAPLEMQTSAHVGELYCCLLNSIIYRNTTNRQTDEVKCKQIYRYMTVQGAQAGITCSLLTFVDILYTFGMKGTQQQRKILRKL